MAGHEGNGGEEDAKKRPLARVPHFLLRALHGVLGSALSASVYTFGWAKTVDGFCRMRFRAQLGWTRILGPIPAMFSHCSRRFLLDSICLWKPINSKCFPYGPRYGGLTLEWPWTWAGHTYRIEYSNQPQGASHWIIATNMVLNASPTVWIDPAAAVGERRFYRVLRLP